ncbi:hypothetical protein [Gulosibacter bifidus]|uniref:Uncharacterized protein n=1 Tax=Gulosibacter bifidus TaxID=272239 RepID=A0ABW5RI89_9MICO|nr:hypothetical protein [Gulosibacter bifidus]
MLDWLNDYGSAITALAAVVGVFIAAWQLHSASKEVRSAAEQRQSESFDRNRPYVTLDVIPGLAGKGTWDLRIENIGGSYARNVKLAFVEGGLNAPDDGDGAEFVKALQEFLNSTWSMAPGSSRRLLWHYSRGEDLTEEPKAAFTTWEATLQVTYEWQRTNEQPVKFAETYSYNTRIFGRISPVAGLGTTVSGSAPAEKQLSSIDRKLQRLVFNLAELRR